MGRSTDEATFSVGWIFVSYFAICGGIVVALGGLIWTLQNVTLDARAAGYVACGAGGLIGGFFSGRASRHFSVLEPAIGGALVVGSVYGMVKWTALGPLVFAFAEETIARESLVLGGLAFGGGLTGALLGELSWRRPPSRSALRWLGMTIFLTAGALLAAIIATSVGFADQTLTDPEALQKLLRQGALGVDHDHLAMALIVVLASAGFTGGLIAQIAAPRQLLLIAPIAVFLALASALVGLMAYVESLDRESIQACLVLAGAAALLGLFGAFLVWLIRRLSGR